MKGNTVTIQEGRCPTGGRTLRSMLLRGCRKSQPPCVFPQTEGRRPGQQHAERQMLCSSQKPPTEARTIMRDVPQNMPGTKVQHGVYRKRHNEILHPIPPREECQQPECRPRSDTLVARWSLLLDVCGCKSRFVKGKSCQVRTRCFGSADGFVVTVASGIEARLPDCSLNYLAHF